MNAQFNEIQTPIGTTWLHTSRPVWIRYYEPIEGARLGFYQAYRAVEHVPKGRDPWTVDNRRIGHVNYGFKTLEDAMDAANNYKGGN